MPVNANLPRWVFASLSKYITDNTPEGLPAQFFTGDDRLAAKVDNFCEWRLDGPINQSPSRSESIDRFVLDCLVSVDNSGNAHRIWTNVGLAMSLFIDFQVYRFGEGDADDDSLVGCMRQVGKISVAQFGQLSPKVRVYQAAVSANYILETQS